MQCYERSATKLANIYSGAACALAYVPAFETHRSRSFYGNEPLTSVLINPLNSHPTKRAPPATSSSKFKTIFSQLQVGPRYQLLASSLLLLLLLTCQAESFRLNSSEQAISANGITSSYEDFELISSSPRSQRSTVNALFNLLTSPFAKTNQQSRYENTTPLSPTTTSAPISETTLQEENGTQDDDYDAESCKGISAHESAETKSLTDNERLVNLQSCLQRKVRRNLMSATRRGMEIFEKLSLSGGCASSLVSLMSSLGEIKAFAFKCKLLDRFNSKFLLANLT